MLLFEPPCCRSNHLAAMIVKQTKFDGMMYLLQQHLPTGVKEWLGNEVIGGKLYTKENVAQRWIVEI
ncbi:hypothetical protein M8C21_007818 [Ambrosia artemisiifolia]|uniref:Uncharacterized protein n=1 Tax=Ambrosia artemisiifolia TaxID=4212 RepID=A0AAD5D0R6_AMBAR|nr:hypothetical protein M8C21_007818 [Ambrosia artemisiifolia]